MTDVRSPGLHTYRAKGLVWAFVPVVLLGAMFVGWGAMITLALDDPAFGVEANYYEKAVHFDEYQAQARESKRLGWVLDVAPQVAARSALVRVTLRDRNLKPIDGASVRATAFHVARSSQVQQFEFRGDGAGRYTHEIAPYRRGLWEFRFEVLEGSRRFVQVERVSLEDVNVP